MRDLLEVPGVRLRSGVRVTNTLGSWLALRFEACLLALMAAVTFVQVLHPYQQIQLVDGSYDMDIHQ